MNETILIIEDETAIREMLAYTLIKSGYNVEEAPDAGQARLAITKTQPDLILMDWMLPGLSGVDFTRELSAEPDTMNIPVIMLTARADETDKIRALDTGADDYVTKPFSPRELLARIRAVLRRRGRERLEETIELDGLVLDPATHRVTAGGEAIETSPAEFRLLHFFLTHTERVYTRAQLLDQVWGEKVYVEERTVDVHIRRLRKTLKHTGFDKYIQTVHGIGYRFSAD